MPADGKSVVRVGALGFDSGYPYVAIPFIRGSQESKPPINHQLILQVSIIFQLVNPTKRFFKDFSVLFRLLASNL